MKKIIFNINDVTYEKLRFESIHEKKSIQQIIQERIFYKPFSEEVQNSFDEFMENELIKVLESD